MYRLTRHRDPFILNSYLHNQGYKLVIDDALAVPVPVPDQVYDAALLCTRSEKVSRHAQPARSSSLPHPLTHYGTYYCSTHLAVTRQVLPPPSCRP